MGEVQSSPSYNAKNANNWVARDHATRAAPRICEGILNVLFLRLSGTFQRVNLCVFTLWNATAHSVCFQPAPSSERSFNFTATDDALASSASCPAAVWRFSWGVPLTRTHHHSCPFFQTKCSDAEQHSLKINWKTKNFFFPQTLNHNCQLCSHISWQIQSV